MDTLTRPEVAALAAERRSGWSLQAPFYTSPDIFELDCELIFSRHWIFVAVEPDIPEPGDYVTIAVGRASVIIVRDDDMQVRAFHNVCRHRGSKILLQESGFTGNLVCPYHQWTYDLSGRLIHAQSLPRCAETGQLGLKPVHVRNLFGLIFICLADDPPADFEAMEAALAPYLAPHHLANCKIAKRIDIVEEGNWKLTIENNRECYHCGGHPELLCSLFHFFGYSTNDVDPSQREYFERFQRTQAEFERIWEANGLAYKPIERLSGRATAFRTERLALDGPGESYTMDARVASRKLINGFASPRIGALHLHTQPNSWHHFLSDHAISFSVLPLSAERTLLRTTWMVARDAVEGVDYDLENLTRVWRATNEQDSTFVGYAQAGISSPAYVPGPFSPAEYMVNDFGTWYTERLSAHLGAESAVKTRRKNHANRRAEGNQDA